MVSFCRKIIIALTLFLLPVVGSAGSSLPKARVKIGDVDILVDVPTTPALQYKGLGQRDYLPEMEGMLFIFPEADFYAFHMKDMRFPIDIIWIRSHVVVDISKNVPVSPGPDLPTYRPSTKADMVLEVNANFTNRYNIRWGDKVRVVVLE